MEVNIDKVMGMLSHCVFQNSSKKEIFKTDKRKWIKRGRRCDELLKLILDTRLQ